MSVTDRIDDATRKAVAAASMEGLAKALGETAAGVKGSQRWMPAMLQYVKLRLNQVPPGTHLEIRKLLVDFAQYHGPKNLDKGIVMLPNADDWLSEIENAWKQRDAERARADAAEAKCARLLKALYENNRVLREQDDD